MDDRARWKSLPAELDTAKKSRDGRTGEVAEAFSTWLASAAAERRGKDIQIPGEYLRLALNEGTGTNTAGRLEGSSIEHQGADATRLDDQQWSARSGAGFDEGEHVSCR